MRRAARLFMFMALVLANGCSCDPPTTVTLGAGDGARVTVDTAPLRVSIDNADGGHVVSLVGVHTATDLYFEEAQIVPGWDGYQESVDAWLPATAAVIVEHDDQHVVLDLSSDDDGVGGRLVITAQGERVRIHTELAPPLSFAPQKSSFTFELRDDESFFGLGERFASLDHRGQSLYAWAEEGGLGGGEDPEEARGTPGPNGPSMTYFPVPFMHSSAGYAVWLDTTMRSEMHLGTESSSRWRTAINGGTFDVVLYVTPQPLRAIDLYTQDTGRPIEPAPWVFGPRRRVSPGQRVDGVDEWRLLRERNVPTTGLDDSIHFLPHLSHAGREAELAAWTSELHANGFKVMAYNNPYVSTSIDTARTDFEFGRDNDLFLKDAFGEVGEVFFISGEPQTIATIDLTNPDAVAWFQTLLQRTLDLGYDGWMHDFGEYVARDWVASDGTTGDVLHNLFPVLSARAAYELMERERPNDYLFFVRSGYTGTQAFVPAVWGGDAEASFDDTQGIPSALRSGLSLSMSGVPYWGSDTTGFKCLTNALRDKEMYVRWAQLSAVSPIMMEQNACANPLEDRSKWTLWSDDETTQLYGDMSRLHTRLQPYFLVLAREAHETGAPIMRHPFLLHPRDLNARQVDGAFYLGSALYAAPVIRRGETTKTTWIPPGTMIDLDDGTLYEGAQIVDIPAPLQKLPLLLIENQLVPMLDASIETLAESTDPNSDVVTPSRVADKLDALVLLTGDRASFALIDGTTITVSHSTLPPSADADVTREPFGDVDRVTFVTALGETADVVAEGVRVEVSGAPVARTTRVVVFVP